MSTNWDAFSSRIKKSLAGPSSGPWISSGRSKNQDGSEDPQGAVGGALPDARRSLSREVPRVEDLHGQAGTPWSANRLSDYLRDAAQEEEISLPLCVVMRHGRVTQAQEDPAGARGPHPSKGYWLG